MLTVTSGACGANTPQAATMPHVQMYKKPHVRMCKKPDVQMHKIPDVEMYNYTELEAQSVDTVPLANHKTVSQWQFAKQV